MLPLRDNVPTRRVPVVTIALIAANFAVWFWELHARIDRGFLFGGATVYLVAKRPPLRRYR